MNQRIREIDICRGFAIIFIVLGHILVHCDKLYGVFKVIYGFHVPLFFIISGMVFSARKPFGRFVSGKFKRIMVPYFFFAFLFLVPYAVLGRGVSSDLGVKAQFSLIENCKDIFYGVGEGARLKQNSSLWFLPVLFVMELMFYGLEQAERYAGKNARKALVLLMAVAGYIVAKARVIFPWGISSALTLGLFMEIGNYIRKHQVIDGITKNSCMWLYCIGSLFTGGYIILTNQTFDCANYNYGNLVLSYLGAFLLSVVALLISKRIDTNRCLMYIGRNTMGILIFHKLVIVLFQSKLGRISALLCHGPAVIEGLLCLVTAAVSITISLVANKVIRVSFPVLLGEKRKTYEKDNI